MNTTEREYLDKIESLKARIEGLEIDNHKLRELAKRNDAVDMLENNCVLCGNEFEDYYDQHNPWPVAHIGKCCGQCNRSKVIPARMKPLKENF